MCVPCYLVFVTATGLGPKRAKRRLDKLPKHWDDPTVVPHHPSRSNSRHHVRGVMLPKGSRSSNSFRQLPKSQPATEHTTKFPKMFSFWACGIKEDRGPKVFVLTSFGLSRDRPASTSTRQEHLFEAQGLRGLLPHTGCSVLS